ncbi:hypothetical protein, partial [Pararhodobacter sp. CCB-MM2]|uniref:DUF445 domain-containing protein n=2 Tax=Pseudomonadota TaxID=1224 RepID=UPI0018F5E65A
LTVGRIVNAMLNGPKCARTRALIKKHVKPVVDDTAGISKPLTQLALGPKKFADLKLKVGDKAVEISSEMLDDPMFNQERAEAVESIMRSRMESLSPEEFQNLLRPCFQEDEIKLIAIGGVLGALAGLLQLIFIFDWAI